MARLVYSDRDEIQQQLNKTAGRRTLLARDLPASRISDRLADRMKVETLNGMTMRCLNSSKNRRGEPEMASPHTSVARIFKEN